VRQKLQVLFIGLVIILILVGECIIYLPQQPVREAIEIRSYPSTNALAQALTNDEVDVAPFEQISPQTLLQLNEDPNLNIVPISNFGFTYIGFNTRNPPLNNSIFREAMLYGFDRQRVVKDVLANYGETLTPGLFSSAYATLGWRNDSVNSYPYDPVKASQLLNSIGFNESSDGVRINPSTRQKLRTMILFSKLSDPQAVAAANLFAQDMQAIGLPIINFPESDFDFNSQVKVTYYFDLYIDTESASASPAWLFNLFARVSDTFPAPLSTNLVGYHNSNFDKCSRQLMTSSDSSSAREAALRCQEQLGVDIPAIPVYSKELLIAERKGAMNIIPISGSIDDTIAASLENMTAGGLIRIGEVAGLTDINPTTVLAAADSLALKLIANPILSEGKHGSLQPGIIDRWEITDNASKLTMFVRQGSRFEDGNPVTAHDLAATLNWLISNMLPSTPLYPILDAIRSIREVDDRTVQIVLARSNYFAAYDFGNLFVLQANTLPMASGPFALLLSGAFENSGPFTLSRFVQGNEVDLKSSTPPGAADYSSLNGVQSEDIYGLPVGGSQVQVISQPLTFEDQPIENATFTVTIRDSGSESVLHGSYAGLGVYHANLNLNNETLSAGDHRVTTQLLVQLSGSVIIQYSQTNLVIHPPQFLQQVTIYVLAALAVGYAFYDLAASTAKRSKKRVRRPRRTQIRRRRTRR